jgi:hypothetical protein
MEGFHDLTREVVVLGVLVQKHVRVEVPEHALQSCEVVDELLLGEKVLRSARDLGQLLYHVPTLPRKAPLALITVPPEPKQPLQPLPDKLYPDPPLMPPFRQTFVQPHNIR